MNSNIRNVSEQRESPSYGVDAPNVIRNLILIGMGICIVGAFIPKVRLREYSIPLGLIVILFGCSFLVSPILMLLYADKGKFRLREILLAKVAWRGDENVLDVGTGRGLLVIGAAKRLVNGKAVGIDIWNAEDLSGNQIENTLRNVEIEGVREKVEIRNEDARRISFPDQYFDVIVSNLCLHNIYDPQERSMTRRSQHFEMARAIPLLRTTHISRTSVPWQT